MPDYSGRPHNSKSELELMLDARRTDLDMLLESAAELATDEPSSIEEFEDYLQLTDSWAAELKAKYDEQRQPLEQALERTESLFKPLKERIKLARQLATTRLEAARDSIRAQAKSTVMPRVNPAEHQAGLAALRHGRKRA